MTQPPLDGTARLAAIKRDPYTVDVTRAGGPVDAREQIAPTCWGYFPAAPTYVLDWQGEGDLALWAESPDDLTLVVVTPAGDWICNDDSGPANWPALLFQSALRGLYHVWVGTFLDRGPLPGTLRFSTATDRIDPSPDIDPVLKLPSG